MIAHFVSSGKRSAGAAMLAYVLHDSTGGRPADTADRVEHAWGIGVDHPTDFLDAAESIIDRQRDLKRAAGVSLRGRKCTKPFDHLVLSLPPGQRLDAAGWEATVHGALDAARMGDCIAVAAVHRDHDHRHAHIVGLRIRPTDGRTVDRKQSDSRSLSRWAEGWEKANGGIVIPERAERNAARAERVDLRCQLEAAGMRPERARVHALRCVPIPPVSGRGREKVAPGRQDHTDADRAEWSAALADEYVSAAERAHALRRIVRDQSTRRVVRKVRAYLPGLRPAPDMPAAEWRRTILRRQAARGERACEHAARVLERGQRQAHRSNSRLEWRAVWQALQTVRNLGRRFAEALRLGVSDLDRERIRAAAEARRAEELRRLANESRLRAEREEYQRRVDAQHAERLELQRRVQEWERERDGRPVGPEYDPPPVPSSQQPPEPRPEPAPASTRPTTVEAPPRAPAPARDAAVAARGRDRDAGIGR